MRVPVPFSGPSIAVVTATDKRKGFSIQNVGAVDIYYSDDQRTLDTLGAGGIPQGGHLLAAQVPVPPPTVYQIVYGLKIYVRAPAAGALLEVLIYDIDKC